MTPKTGELVRTRNGACEVINASAKAPNATITITANKLPFCHGTYQVLVDGAPGKGPTIAHHGPQRNVMSGLNSNLFTGTLDEVTARMGHVTTGPIVLAYSEAVGLLKQVADELRETSALLDSICSKDGTG